MFISYRFVSHKGWLLPAQINWKRPKVPPQFHLNFQGSEDLETEKICRKLRFLHVFAMKSMGFLGISCLPSSTVNPGGPTVPHLVGPGVGVEDGQAMAVGRRPLAHQGGP